MPSVTQSWMEDVPLRMQSVLLLGLRGPDTHGAPNIKQIVRWLRGLAFRPGNPENVVEFTRAEPPTRILEKTEIAKELEFCSQHYYSHLMHALEVIGYCHPTRDTRAIGFTLYHDMCFIQHLPVEGKEDFVKRLGHMPWPGLVVPETGEEAFNLMKKAGVLSTRDQEIICVDAKDSGAKVDWLIAPSRITRQEDLKRDDNY